MGKLTTVVLLVAIAAAVGSHAAADSPPGDGFGLPLDCELGKDCWIMNYPDAGKGDARHDFKCNHLTYNRHKGTDFAIRDLAAMVRGVAVIAAADGTVLGLRDGMKDGEGGDIGGRECGNGVSIGHENGWRTQYCHFRRGSVEVRKGQTVLRGDRLGFAGMSGKAEFPHVHFEPRRGGKSYDPFTGAGVETGCGAAATPLWRAESRPEYNRLRLYAAGFATGPVGLKKLQADASSPDRLPTDAPALVLWTVMLGVRPGDMLSIRIIGPGGGALYSVRRELKRAQIRRLEFGGVRRPGSAWPKGDYVGEIGLDTPDQPPVRRRVKLTIR